MMIQMTNFHVFSKIATTKSQVSIIQKLLTQLDNSLTISKLHSSVILRLLWIKIQIVSFQEIVFQLWLIIRIHYSIIMKSQPWNKFPTQFSIIALNALLKIIQIAIIIKNYWSQIYMYIYLCPINIFINRFTISILQEKTIKIFFIIIYIVYKYIYIQK